MSRASALLHEQGYVCVDLETTGGNPLHHRIIEVGLVVVNPDGSAESFSSLVHPGCRIPAGIQAFTGITNEAVAAAPPFADIAREVLSRLEGRLFVAHNARFDYGFLRAEFRRLGWKLQVPVLCTVKLSRQLFPEERRHNLDAVIARHGLTCTARHRALGDAEVLVGFLAQVRERFAPAVLQPIVEGLLRQAPLPVQLPADALDDLPDGPGVYRFFGADDALLYVGKSKRLRDRVLEHFQRALADPKEAKLARMVQRVEWTETAGELGALLLEARLVKELQPLHNRRLRKSEETYTVVLPEQGTGRAAVLPLEELPAGEAAYGLHRSAADARKALEALARGKALCLQVLGLERPGPGGGSCFGFQVGRCKGACIGREPIALHTVRARLALAPQQLPAWPHPGPVALVEKDWRGEQEWHVIHQWRHLGTAHDEEELRSLRSGALPPFDPDIYRLLSRALATHPVRSL
jgi:DNA polymerase III subunit epsilon